MEGDAITVISTERSLDISTHALTWRATKGVKMPIKIIRDFYPRPHMEGDASGHLCAALRYKYFYPRPHMEGDILPGSVARGIEISTHALTWRAT